MCGCTFMCVQGVLYIGQCWVSSFYTSRQVLSEPGSLRLRKSKPQRDSGITDTHQYVPFLHGCWGLCCSPRCSWAHHYPLSPTKISFCRIKIQQLCHGERGDRTLLVSPGAGNQQLPLSPSPWISHLRAKDEGTHFPFHVITGWAFRQAAGTPKAWCGL